MGQADAPTNDGAGTDGAGTDGAGTDGAENCVRLIGRVSAAPERRQLPSGDTLVSFRLVVSRPAEARARSSITVDTVDCVVWQPALQQHVLAWSGGERVDVDGSLRRRFWRTPTGASSRTEVEVERARVG